MLAGTMEQCSTLLNGIYQMKSILIWTQEQNSTNQSFSN